jgi:fatty-acyl-CoA synthase
VGWVCALGTFAQHMGIAVDSGSGGRGESSALEVRGLLDWLEEPSSDRGLSFARDGDGWETVSYQRLAGLVHATAGWLASQEDRPGGHVAIVLPTCVEFPTVLFGALVSGATPCPLAPTSALQSGDAYVEHLAGLLRRCDPAMIVTDDQHAPMVELAATRAQIQRPPLILPKLSPQEGSERRAAAELALLQFTSGSSGQPRGARVTWSNLTANIELLRRWTRSRADDLGVTFLPMFHDMGLIGSLLMPCCIGANVRVMRPEQFVASPLRWLSCFGLDGATGGPAPTFALAYTRRRVREASLEGMDFSRWRMIVVGAERVDAATLRGFLDWLGPHGLPASAFCPAYGLAEATLAVSGVEMDRAPRCVRPRWSDMRDGATVGVLRARGVDDLGGVEDGSDWLVSSGHPLPGIDVAVVDEGRDPLPEGHLGELFVRGPSIVDGYLGEANGQGVSFVEGGLMTGDAGFMLAGELFVCGRIGDSLNVRGRKLYAEDLEARVEAIAGVGPGRVVVLAGATARGDGIALLIQGRRSAWLEEAESVLRALAGPDPAIEVLTVTRKTILRTSSGKPRRRAMWERYLSGEYERFRTPQLEPA